MPKAQKVCDEAHLSLSAHLTLLAAPPSLLPALRTACAAALAAEAALTKYDTAMGDGDCGLAVAGVCNSLLAQLKAAPFVTKAPPFFAVLTALNDCLEDMGGSLGAILSILLTALAGNLRRAAAEEGERFVLDVRAVGEAAKGALGNLCAYTGARVGDRTVMDALVPFCEGLQATGDVEMALEAAEDGARRTAAMTPRFGRATYVGDHSKGDAEAAPPDAGAYAVAVFLRGLVEGGGWA